MGAGCGKQQGGPPQAIEPVRLASVSRASFATEEAPSSAAHTSGDMMSECEVSSTSRSTPGDPTEEYLGAAIPADEEERLATLKSLKVLDTEPERRFDDITKLCCMIFKVPMCLVSLVDTERQWFKSVQGIDAKETSRKSSFCAWTLLPVSPEVLIVENALEDLRFRNNPLVVGFPHIRFYGGTPLVASNGKRVGSLCVIDNKPRTFDTEACTLLTNFGEMVVRELEKEKMLAAKLQESAALSQEKNQLLRTINCFGEAVMLCNFSLPSWPVMFVNESWEKATGISKDQATASQFWSLFKLKGSEEDAAAVRSSYLKAIADQQTFTLNVMSMQPDSELSLSLQFRSANNNTLDKSMPVVGIPSNLAGPLSGGGTTYYYVTITASSTAMTSAAGGISGSKIFSLVDDKLDPFEDVRLGALLGRGAFGRVYRGQWNNSSVAVKVLEHAEDGTAMMEALLSSQVSHPNVVQTFKHCTRTMPSAQDTDGNSLLETWIIMEFCNKGTLSDAVDRGLFRQKHSLFEVDYEVIVATARDIVSAMAYLHSNNILHGDLTGQNILLAASETGKRQFSAKVADFGFSRVLETQNVKTKSYGTISHTPPELLIDGILSKAADVYAFGVLMWEMYMGQRPFMGMTHGQIIHHISSRRGLSLSASCPPPMRKLILACTTPKHEERPSFAQLMTDLEELEEDLC